MKNIKIAIVNYPTASQTAVHGLVEAMTIANTLCEQLNASVRFDASINALEHLDTQQSVRVVVLPPCINDDFYMQENPLLYQYLSSMQQQGALLASACAGAFILAKGGFLDNKFCTTHWRLADSFRSAFPELKLNENAIIVNEGDVITAGGLMAWLDLLFEIVSLYSSPTIAQQLSKEMVVDNGFREQRFYRQFVPKRDHGDELVLKAQDYLDANYAEPISVKVIAEYFFVSQRTLQRRFLAAVGHTIIQYLQKLRLHHACQLIELTGKGVTEISYEVGYQDISAFRKVFLREFGLTPTEFRKRFSTNRVAAENESAF
ncbi:GlxA family transcriptional regulator [Grimontia sp. NTOU-MAR1]|uniref:GlxA family transcriptional regulator n=1 Tax=Grimontia sp. NTOU-MAR1 TaxID=3111011 RepID=UPI002DC01EBB|nr:helix-turn-helix domain-containing protein [Grimontia sp. NTOU-MAR1]WRW00248.1 helix-turn-helix domain-containing protein [Grimontia sp. NTOU-MAR1]